MYWDVSYLAIRGGLGVALTLAKAIHTVNRFPVAFRTLISDFVLFLILFPWLHRRFGVPLVGGIAVIVIYRTIGTIVDRLFALLSKKSNPEG